MEYEKKPLSFEDQADLLMCRGLQADRDELIRRLEAVSYYRLSGYLYPYRITESDEFQPGTSLAMIWQRYNFDHCYHQCHIVQTVMLIKLNQILMNTS